MCDALPDEDEGQYRVCVTKDDIVDCVDIEVRVLVTCQLEDSVQTEGDTWREGKWKVCECTAYGEAVCKCDENQGVTCDGSEEIYYDAECNALCSREPATCTITGDPHYKSFDGHRHDFQGGSCRFTLIKTDDFELFGRNGHRYGSTQVSWNDEIELTFEGVRYWSGEDGAVKAGDKELCLPYEKRWRSGRSISIIKAGTTVVIKVGLENDVLGLEVKWDGNSTVDATVHGQFFEKTAGLCGTWDLDNQNDQVSKEGNKEDVETFGWSWRYEDETGECKEAPKPPHPCDETVFPAAKEIADAACDILKEAPFSACHSVVDVEAALHNCKFDVCSCYDNSCACPIFKKFAQECLEAGVSNLTNWRDFAKYCPMDCKSPLTYLTCGSFCPPTCADKTPDCGKDEGKCNEGCFCPRNTYLQDGKCVAADECLCEYNGEFKDVGETWLNPDTCKDCQCREKGEMICEPVMCKKCSKSELPYYKNDDDCCRSCAETWVWADPEKYENVEYGKGLEIQCSSLVKPYRVAWYKKSGDEWEPIVGKSMKLQIDEVTAKDAGVYMCVARKSYRQGSAQITVTVAEKPSSCTPVAPDNGLVIPESDVNIGEKVTYKCEDDFYVKGDVEAVCLDTGELSSVPECVPIEVVSLPGYAVKVKKGEAKINCNTKDKSFKDVDMKFEVISGKAEIGATRSSTKGKQNIYSATVSQIEEDTTVICTAYSEDGKKRLEGKIVIQL